MCHTGNFYRLFRLAIQGAAVQLPWPLDPSFAAKHYFKTFTIVSLTYFQQLPLHFREATHGERQWPGPKLE